MVRRYVFRDCFHCKLKQEDTLFTMLFEMSFKLDGELLFVAKIRFFMFTGTSKSVRRKKYIL